MTTIVAATSWAFTILGAPRTKKSHNNAFILPSKDPHKGQPCPHCKGRLLTIVDPSPVWKRWVKEAAVLIPARTSPAEGARLARIRIEGKLVTYVVPDDGRRPAWPVVPLTVPLNLEARYYRDANRGDLFGYHQGLGDFLQEWGIIENDVQICRTDGSRLLKDAETPRVELVLEAVA